MTYKINLIGPIFYIVVIILIIVYWNVGLTEMTFGVILLLILLMFILGTAEIIIEGE